MGAMESHGEDDEVNKLADQIGNNLFVSEDENLRAVAALIEKNKAKKIMVLSGAGVSVAAGIPDFRTPGTGKGRFCCLCCCCCCLQSTS